MMPLFKFSSSLNKRLFISYGTDWVLVFIMLAIFFGVDTIPPYHREFSINDTTLMHKFTVHETVPIWLLAVIAILVPFIIISVISLGFRKSWLDFNSGLLGLALALSMTIMFTDIIKVTVGRPRPDMFDRCKPPVGIQDPPLGLLNYTICTADHNTYNFNDGFKSFPSGHSSTSFAGLGYLAFYLAGKMHLFDEGGHTYKSFVFSFPFIGALLVAISRLHDYRHHWQDVLVGGLIGTGFAYFAYRQYYPSIAAEYSQKPFPPRFKRAQDIFPDDDQRRNDIEIAVGPNDPVYDEYTDRPRSTSSIDRHFDHFVQSTANGGVNKHDRQDSSSTEHLITPHSEPSNHRH